MSNTYNGINALTTAMGDTGASFEVTLENQSSMTKVEPLTKLPLPAGETVLVNVTGDLAHAQLVKNIQQINAMAGFEVIGVSSVAVGGGTGGNESIFPTLLHAIETNKQLTYSSGDLSSVGQSSSFGYVAIKPMSDGESLRIIVPELAINQEIKFLLQIQNMATSSASSAYVSIIRNGDDTIVRTTNHEFIAQSGTILGIRRDENKLIAENASDDSTSPANLDVVIDAYLHVVGSNSVSSDVPALQIYAPSGEEG